jgi:O-antigen/teichoic acid export membrane protein
MHFLYTAEYGSGDVSLAILIWFIPVVYLTQLLGSVLGAMDQQRAVFQVSAANVLFNLCANLVLIPMWREAGAAVVTVLTETLGLVLLSIRLRRSIPVLYSVRSIVLILLATVPGAACALLPSFLPFLVRASAAVVATALCLWLLRLITPDDVRRMLAGAGKPAERPPDRQAGDAA